jgi:hypothetical protein
MLDIPFQSLYHHQGQHEIISNITDNLFVCLCQPLKAFSLKLCSNEQGGLLASHAHCLFCERTWPVLLMRLPMSRLQPTPGEQLSPTANEVLSQWTGKKPRLTRKALIPAVCQFASLEGLTIGDVFEHRHPLLDRFIDHDESGKEYCVASRNVGNAQSRHGEISIYVYNDMKQEAVQQRAEVYDGLVYSPAVLRAYLAGAFDDVDKPKPAKYISLKRANGDLVETRP